MTSFIAAGGSGRSTSFIPAVPAAWSVTTIAFMVIFASVICLNHGCVSPRHMRRYREPLSVPLRPAIGISPVRLQSVRRGVAESGVNDGEVAHDADLHAMGLRVLD